MVNKNWIKKAVKEKKKGALHRQLGIPGDKKIPKNVLSSIVKKSVGEKVMIEGKLVTVTLLLKRRANLALNLRNLRK